jgi:double-stranded uracil-DNA glycosylase
MNGPARKPAGVGHQQAALRVFFLWSAGPYDETAMTLADQILSINEAIQKHMRDHAIRVMTADEAADVVYSVGILSPDQGPPDAPGFTFRQFLRDLRDQHGYEALVQLLGAKQKDNKPGGHYILLRFDPPSKERVEELLTTEITQLIDQPGQADSNSLPDYLQNGLDVVFVGTSVGEESAKREHYYSDPHNKFWDLVNQSDLVSDMVGAENDHLVLDEKCGLTDLVKKRVSSSDSNIEAADFDVEGFTLKIERYKPKVVAFNGKRAYREVYKKDPNDYGLTDEIIGDSYVFVLPSSSGADASMTFEKKLHWYKKLKATLRTV